MNIFSLQTNIRSQTGFALLYAVIVIAVLSSLGSVLANLLVRESRLSATSRQSSRAYYSADAGQECALYWDLQRNHFPAPPKSPGNPNSITCSDESGISISTKDPNNDKNEYRFSISSNTYDICTGTTTVTKERDSGRLITQIESLGNNTCGSNVEVQRALRTTY
jgi:Tfp pilus assembly protein PilX